MKSAIQALLVSVTLFASYSGYTHHSFSVTFTKERTSDIEGVVTKFSFKNPHVLVYVDVTNEDGSVMSWVSEGASATSMRSSGWDADSIQPGQIVRISGDATHDGSPMTSLESIAIVDPETGIAYSVTEEEGRNSYQPEIAESVPLKLEDGRPNLSSVWSNRRTRGGAPGQFQHLVLSEKGEALQAEFELSTDTQVFCDPPGLARQVVTPHPLKITQLDDRVILEYEEFGGYREIFFDSRAALGINTHFGDSVARYEGDSLIIETTHLLANQATNLGNWLSDGSTMVERYSRSDSAEQGTAIVLDLVISDPVNLAEDIAHSMRYLDQGAYEFIENDCQPPLRERETVSPAMNFFLTSEGLGDGADLGGLAGADAHCNALAAQVGQGDKNWQAYLSATGDNSVNARDRIGSGPWYNAKGVPIATDLNDLHGEAAWLTKSTSVTEKGDIVNGRGDSPNRHDVLTGSKADGTVSVSDEDTTCSNWTSNDQGSALVGHFDRVGGGDNPSSWNQAHGSRGCSQENLRASGGDGLFYCFASESE